jgi:pimeloyl-ACP methyl ester carboxylesterase
MPSTITAVSLRSRRGVRLAGRLQLPAGVEALATVPTVVLCHGMESTKDGTKHQALARGLSACGYACLRFDFSYVGESEGAFEDLTISGEVEDLAGACDHLWAEGVGEIGIIGSSLGGAVAVLFASDEPRVRALVTIAAVARPIGIVERLPADVVASWRSRGVREWGGGRLKRDFLDDLEHVDVLGAAARVRAATLVTHGSNDRVVPVADAEALYRALPQPKELRITPGGDHRYSDPVHLATLLEDAQAWIVAHLAAASATRRRDARPPDEAAR